MPRIPLPGRNHSSRKARLTSAWRIFLLAALAAVLMQFLLPLPGQGGIVAAAGTGTGTGTSTADPRPQLKISYFHSNPCESCQAGAKFTETVYAAAKLAGLDTKIRFTIYEQKIFREADQVLLKKLFGQYQVPADSRLSGEYVFAGTSWLGGEAAIEAGLTELLQKEAAALLANPTEPASSETTAAGTETVPGTKSQYMRQLAASPDTWLYYFYTSPCANCEQVAGLLDGLGDQVEVSAAAGTVLSDLHLIRQNIADPAVLAEARKYFAAWAVPEADQKVPILFIGSRYLSGSQAILAELPGLVKSGQGQFQATLLPAGNGSPGADRLLTGYEVAGVFLTGLVNGFNPCSLSMLLFFISLLLARGANLLKFGLSFLAGKALAYLALGTVSYRLLQYLGGSWFSRFQLVLKIILIVVFIGLAAANLSDFLAARSERYNRIRMQLPAVLRKKNHTWLKRLAGVSDPRLLLLVSFLAGLLISVGEFLCTGQIYLATILYVLNVTGSFSWQALGYFLLYVAGIILPLLVLTIVLHKGQALYLVSEAVRRQMPAIKLATALVFLAFAAAAWFIF